MVAMNDLARQIADKKSGPRASEHVATVIGKDAQGTYWVSIPGGAERTPVATALIEASAGDTVMVAISDGRCIMSGNVSSPSASTRSVSRVGAVANMAMTTAYSEKARIDELSTTALTAQSALITELQADTAKVHDLTAEQIGAATAYVGTLSAGDVTAQDIISDHAAIGSIDVDSIAADHAVIANLDSNYAHLTNGVIDNATIGHADVDGLSANYAHVTNGTIDNAKIGHADVDGLSANYAHVTNGTIDNAKIGYADVNGLSTNYAQIDMANVSNAWVENGTIKDGAISSAMINDVSANKLTAGTINGSVINVTNLNADNITAGTINGQRIGTGSLSLDKLSEDVYTEAEVNAIVDGLNDRIDGAIETHTGTVVPTLNNSPASAWNTTDLKDEHVGDVYYVVNSQSQQNGYCYRFTKSGNNYSWQLIKDSDVTAALSRLETAEGKITTFDSDISTLKTDTGTLKTKTQSLETSLGDKVDTSTFNELSSTVDENSSSITSMSTVLTNNGLTSSTNITNTVNTVSQTATGNSSKITQLISTLGTNDDGTTKEGDIVHRTSAVEQDLSGFKTTVSNTYATKTSAEAAQADATKALNRQTAYSATSSTGASTAAKVASCTNFPTLAAGATVTVRFSAANTSTGAITLNVNSTGAKTVYVNGSATSSTNQLLWSANANVTFTYDGSYWRVVSEPRTWYGTCGVAAATAAKTATINEAVICKGTTVTLNMTYENTSESATLNVTSTGAKNVYYGTTTTRPTTANGFGWGAGSTASFVFDGAYWRVGDTTALSRLTTAESTISSHTTQISQNASDIALKANSSEVYTKTQTDGLISTEVTNRNAAITAASNSITASVEETYATKTALSDGIDDAKDYTDSEISSAKAEIKVTTDGISSEVSNKVGSSEIISKINQSAETVKIQASKVEIDGTAIFNSISSNVDSAITSKGYATTGQVATAKSEAISSANSTTDTKLANYSTTTQMNSAISTAMDNIDVGGKNLVWDTAWVDIVDRWSNWGSPTTREIVEINGHSYLHLVTSAAQYQGYSQNPSKRNGYGEISAGDVVMVSFAAYGAASGNTACVGIHWLDSSGSIIKQEWCRQTLTTTRARYVWGPYTVPDNCVGFNVMVGHYEANVQEIWIGDVKIERGNVATDWTPAPEDMTAYVDNSVYQSSQPNLSPFFSYQPPTDTRYWVLATNQTTNVYDGWMTFDMSAASQSDRAIHIRPKRQEWVKPGGRYTLLVELADIVASGTVQWMPRANNAVDQIAFDGSTDTLPSKSFYVSGTALSNAISDSTRTSLVTVAIVVKANATFSGKVRVSLYEGDYSGPYKPYVGNLLYGSVSDAVEYIVGTQTAATGSWTGVTKDSSLYTGKTIAYKLPYAGSGNASLQLKDSAGNNVGGNIAVYSMTTRVTTHYPAQSVIQMSYDGTYWRTAGWYNTNNYDRRLHNNYVKAASAVTSGAMVCGTSAGYKQIAASVNFDLSYPILWASGAWTSGTQYANVYEAYPSVNPATTSTVQGIAVNKQVYLKGTVSGNTFTCAASNFLTCTEPTSADGFVYIPLGTVANDATTKMYFSTSRDLYAFLDGKFRQVTPTEIVATQRIYWRTATSGTPSKPSSWVTATSNSYASWTTKVPPLSSDGTTGESKYPYLYTCEQRKRLDGTVECTAVLLDDSTTIIDGGNIITNSITANKLDANSINASHVITIGAFDYETSNTITDAVASANQALQDASDAAKTATNFITESGVNDMLLTAGPQAYRVRLTSSGMEILNPDGDVVGFHGSTIQLGSTDGIYFEASETRLAFRTLTQEIAYFGLNSDGIWQMHIATTYVDDMIRFGDYAWIKRDNGNMSIKWLGE